MGRSENQTRAMAFLLLFIYFVLLLEMGSYIVALAGPELSILLHQPLRAGITSMNHHAQPCLSFKDTVKTPVEPEMEIHQIILLLEVAMLNPWRCVC